MDTITKEMLVSEVANDTRYSRGMVSNILDSLITNISFQISRGNKVQLNGFGTFKPKKRNARIGRNPHTGEAVPIPARILPAFEPGKGLKNLISQ